MEPSAGEGAMEEDAFDVLERLPVTKMEDEEWPLFPLHTPPPAGPDIPGADALHKSVPRWAPGWQLQWHGSSIYGIANAMAFGEVLPSEGHIPRGRLAVPCAMEQHMRCQGLRQRGTAGSQRWFCSYLLVAIPGSSALPLATWQVVDRSGLSKAAKKRTPGHILDVADDRLDRHKSRAGLHEQREKDWTNSAHDLADQISSSRAYVMGLMVGLMSAGGPDSNDDRHVRIL